MSIETLPVELLEQIVEAAVPPVTNRGTVKERYQTLLNLALVSQRWRRVAQRVLFAEAGLTTPRAAQAFLAATAEYPRFANHVRLFKLYEQGQITAATGFHSFRSLREVYVGNDGELDLAILAGSPQLEVLSVWIALVVCTGDPAATSFPALKILSTCYADWDDRARQIVSPGHLPALQGLAFYHGFLEGVPTAGVKQREWTADFSAFPPSLRLIVSTTAQYILNKRHNVLHETEVGPLYEALDAGYFRNGLRTADVEHLRISIACDVMDGDWDGHRQLTALLKRLPNLKSLFMSSKYLTSTDASLLRFAQHIKEQGILYVEVDDDYRHMEGSLVPPQWLEM